MRCENASNVAPACQEPNETWPSGILLQLLCNRMLVSVAAPLMSITHTPIASGADIAHEPVQDVQYKLDFPRRSGNAVPKE